MAYDLAAMVRAGSGLVFIAVGTLAVWTPKAALRPGQRLLGIFCILYGAAFVAINLGYLDSRWIDAGLALQLFFFLGFLGVLVAFLLRGPWTRTEADRRFVRLGLAASSLMAVALVIATRSWIPGFRDSYPLIAAGAKWIFTYNLYSTFVVFPFIALFGLLAARRARTADSRQARGMAALALGLTLYWAYAAGGGMLAFPDYITAKPGTPLLPVLSGGVFLVVPIGWIALVGRIHPRLAWSVTIGTLLAGLYGQVEPLLIGIEFSSASGIIRAVGGLLVALGLFGDGLGTPVGDRRPVALRKQTMAAGALAILFIVAQIAQNFLSAEYGLLTGGVIAGAVLFAASPVQKAFERMGERKGPPSPASTREDAYRAALRLALRGGITRREELDLARIAEAYGIGPVRALELRAEVEGTEEGTA